MFLSIIIVQQSTDMFCSMGFLCAVLFFKVQFSFAASTEDEEEEEGEPKGMKNQNPENFPFFWLAEDL